MLLHEYLEKESLSFDISLFATDIDRGSLQKAHLANYSLESLQNVIVKRFNKYFYKENGSYQLIPQIQKMVSFSYFDLLSSKHYSPPESIFGAFDIIFCRNVLIYFNLDYQKVIFDKLNRSLIENGFLVLGEAEVPPRHYKRKFRRVTMDSKIYRKI